MDRVSKESVRYRPAGKNAPERCGTCAMFNRKYRTCTLVRGEIAASATCDRWTPGRKK